MFFLSGAYRLTLPIRSWELRVVAKSKSSVSAGSRRRASSSFQGCFQDTARNLFFDLFFNFHHLYNTTEWI